MDKKKELEKKEMKKNELAIYVEKARRNELTKEDISGFVVAVADRFAGQAEINKIQAKVNAQGMRDIKDIQEEYPLLPAEADELAKAVAKKGAEVLGGKTAPAYKDKNLHTKVFSDIHREYKRQYGLIGDDMRQLPYKRLKRKYLAPAIAVVEAYIPPIALENEITEFNEAESTEE